MKLPIAKIMSLVADGADRGIVAFAPLFAEAMPGAVRVAYVQRVASLVAERSAGLARLCGDAQALAIAEKRDLAQHEIQFIQRFINDLRQLTETLPTASQPIGTDELALAYRPRAPAVAPPQAQQVMATKDGGL